MLLLLAGVVQLIMAGAVIVYMIEALNEIDDNTYWFELYVDRVFVALGCSSQDMWDLCKKTHRLSKDIIIANDVVTGLVVILFGVAAFFLFIAGEYVCKHDLASKEAKVLPPAIHAALATLLRSLL